MSFQKSNDMYVSWRQLVDAVLYDSSLYVIYVGYILRSLRMHKLSLDRIGHQCHINLYLHLSFILYDLYLSSSTAARTIEFQGHKL